MQQRAQMSAASTDNMERKGGTRNPRLPDRYDVSFDRFNSQNSHLDVRGSHLFAQLPQDGRRTFSESLDGAGPFTDAP